ncbi:nuclear pore complex subunit [Niveomyces insectorum RCEF 264]|uniref:Nuclear pore complex subunit n=1 Tax=Niveomyces insectorum RCEF 264 TaxID=1081102 RepID=A0A167VGJ8_9HYPO|nr:nuclear pore complex subunit [Niveomyces insectorum RCEF 264]
MAFSFANLGGSVGASAAAAAPAAGRNAQVTEGPDLELIQTEGLGFLSVAGETKLQFVSKWTEPPLPTASLISIASHKGLVAAAGPDAVHIATTESVRKALTAEAGGGGDSDDNNVRPFTPQIRIPMPLRVSQLAFTADEAYLVLSAETGGGLAVYDVQALAQGGGAAQAVFELATSGETLRSLAPNPMADKAELCALITTNGNLLMADLKQRTLRNGPSGQPVLRTQVSCAAWSNKGKQLVAGTADGAVFQLTPDGQEKAYIPKPPRVGDCYVASIAWLENDVFLVVHNPTVPGDPSTYHIITRHAQAGGGTAPQYVYQKLNDPVEPFGDKTPHHTILRLREFPPHLSDLLLVASTAVENIGLLTRSKSSLASSSNVPADKITNVFTTTELADDSKRAQLPMSADYNDTFPVGVALDLSSKDNVPKPIPSDEIDESPGPLPGLWVLNNEGVLVAWWIVYNESIRQGTVFPGLAAVSGGDSAAAAAAAATRTSANPAPPNVAPAFGGVPALGASSSPWGQSTGATSAATGPGSPSRAPAFGAPSALGSRAAFGAPSGLGSQQSVWGSGAKTASAPAFGQSGFGTPATAPGNAPSAFASKAAPFGAAATSAGAPSGGSPFASLANAGQGGFAALAPKNTSGGSIFGSTSSGAKPFGSFGGSSAFGAPSDGTTNAFGVPMSGGTSTAFPPPENKPAGATGSTAFGSSPFVLGTTFKADTASANDNETTPQKSGSGGGLFGSGFGLSLTDAAAAKEPVAPDEKDEDMDTTTPAEPAQPAASDTAPLESTTPTTTPAPAGSRFYNATASPETTPRAPSLFGGANNGTTAMPSLFGKPSGAPATQSLFGKPSGTSSTPANPFARSANLFGEAAVKPANEPSVEAHKAAAPGDELATKAGVDEAKPQQQQQQHQLPLPPDATSKTAYLLGDSSSSSSTSAPSPPGQATAFPSNNVAEEDAPLPPDPFASKTAKQTKSSEPPMPPDFFGSSKTKPAAGTSAAGVPEDAPLPPDPLTAKTKPKQQPTSEEAPVPGSGLFGSVKPSKPGSSSIFSSVPLPSDDPAMRNPFANLAQAPLSPTTDGSYESDLSEGDVEDEDEDKEQIGNDGRIAEEGEEEHEDGDDDEGSGTDIGKDLSRSTTGLVRTPSFTTHGSFTTVAANDASFNSTFSHVEEPRSSQLFGEPPVLRPPRHQQETSPRSPSPQRPLVKHQAGVPNRLFRDESQRSFSAPGMASQILRAATSRQGRDPAVTLQGSQVHAAGVERLLSARRAQRDADLEEQRKADEMRAAAEAKKVPPEDSYDVLDRELDQSLPPTRQLAECLYILDSDIAGGDTVASQVEAVYRDINRMVLVLKLNNRNLDAFLRGHSNPDGHDRKTEEDLDDPDGWVLCDVDNLGAIVSRDLPNRLRQARVKNEDEILADAESLLRGGSRLQVMHDEMVRIIQSQADPDQAAAARSLPLSAEQAAQQNDLRRAFTDFMERLVEAEQQLVLLRTKMSAAAAAAGGTGGGSHGGRGKNAPVPTVDAVMRTIAKMTAMAEKRSGDIDVLEAQIKKLNLDVGRGSREGSPFSTPQKQQQKRASLIFGASSAQRSAQRSSLLFSSPGASAPATPTRKKLSGYTDEEKARLRQARTSRQRALDRLQRIQEAEGPHYMPMDD